MSRQKNEMEIPTAVGSSSSSPAWIELPEDITANILQRLSAVEILERAQKVCTTWRKVCKDPAMWQVVCLYSPCKSPPAMRRLARRAVDLSRGELVDLRIGYFTDDELLNYIVYRCTHLSRLALDCCIDVSRGVLFESLKKLLCLEELHLLNSSFLKDEDVAAIGVLCPSLKSFTFNDKGGRVQIRNCSVSVEGVTDCKEYAIAIARTMPNLVYLSLSGHWMENKGLEAILDGCLHLESLVLRGCYNLDLSGDFGERCSQQIKYLQLGPDKGSDSEEYDDFNEMTIKDLESLMLDI